MLGGANALVLVPHVALLGLPRFGEVFVDILDIYEQPRQAMPVLNALEPGGLGGEAYRSVEVLDGLLNVGEFVNVVDGFCGVATERLDVVLQSGRRRHSVEQVK